MSALRKNGNYFVVLILLGLCLLLTFGNNIRQIRGMSLYDEAWNIHNGAKLLEGELTSFAWGPILSVYFSSFILIFRGTSNWFLESVLWGNFFLSFFIGLSGYLVCRQLVKNNWAYAYFAFFFLLESYPGFLVNQSDAFFASMSAFALWQLLVYVEVERPNHLMFSSMFLGLAALSRNDGLILFGIFFLILVFFVVRQKKSVLWLVRGIIPFVLVVGGYLLFFGLVTGNFSLGTLSRSYIAFKQGHLFVYAGDDGCTFSELECAEMAAEEVYGTGEENQYSVFRAILNNPGAYLNRVRVLLILIPQIFLNAFGAKAAMYLLIFSLFGVLQFIREKRTVELGIMLVWTMYLFVYFLTFFRPGYFQSIYFILTSFAVIGVLSIPAALKNKKEFFLIAGIFVVLGVSLMGISPNILWGLALFFIGTFLSLVVEKFNLSVANISPIPVVFFVLGVFLISGISLPVARPFGDSVEDQAIAIMQEELPAGSLVVGGTPGTIWAGNMEFMTIRTAEYVLPSTGDLHDKLVEQGVDAIYADKSLIYFSDEIWNLIENGIGNQFIPVFENETPPVYLLIVNHP